MQYMGGKARIAKGVAEFLNGRLKDGQPYYEPFCGACNITQYISSNRLRFASDSNRYLIAFWQAVQAGWEPPEEVSKEDGVGLNQGNHVREVEGLVWVKDVEGSEVLIGDPVYDWAKVSQVGVVGLHEEKEKQRVEVFTLSSKSWTDSFCFYHSGCHRGTGGLRSCQYYIIEVKGARA